MKDETYNITVDGAMRLSGAILSDAVSTYKKLLLSYKLSGDESLKPAYTNIEKWFLSDWSQILSLDNGELIIERCQKEVDEEVNRKKRGGNNDHR